MSILEKSIQKSVTDYAKTKYKALCKKMEAGRFGSTGWPDYGFFGWGRPAFFIEFKRPGGKLTELQKLMKTELEARGYDVFVCDNTAHGKAIVDAQLGSAGRRALRYK